MFQVTGETPEKPPNRPFVGRPEHVMFQMTNDSVSAGILGRMASRSSASDLGGRPPERVPNPPALGGRLRDTMNAIPGRRPEDAWLDRLSSMNG